MRRLGIGPRLALGFGLIIFLSASAGLWGSATNRSYDTSNEAFFQQTAITHDLSHQIQANILRIHRNMKDVAMAPQAADMAETLAKVNEAESFIYVALDTLLLAYPGDSAKVETLQADFRAWRTIRSRVVAFKLAGNELEAADITRNQGAEHVSDLERQIQSIIATTDQLRESVADTALNKQQVTSRRMAGLLVCTAILTLLVGAILSRRLTGPMKTLIEFADSIKRGELNRRLGMDRRDEIGLVGNALDEMAESLEHTRSDLAAHQKELEDRVARRTSDLVAANDDLTVEFEVREKIAARLMESEQRMDLVITGSNDGFWDWPDMEQTDIWWSPKLYKMLGKDPAGFWPDFPEFLNLTHPDDRSTVTDIVQQAIDGDDEPEITIRVITAGGDYRWHRLRAGVFRDDDGKAYRMAGSFQDIHDRKWAEDQLKEKNTELISLNEKLNANQNKLIQAEKMSSLGQLAAGVAHEINNPVGFISSNLGTMLEYTEAVGDVIRPMLAGSDEGVDPLSRAEVRQEIQKLLASEDYGFLLEDTAVLLKESLEGTERIGEIVKSLKNFARPDEDTFSLAQINDGLEMSLKMVWNKLKYHCVVTKDFADVPAIYCNIGRLNQVFMNLLVNASQAIKKDGEIVIRTSCQNGYVFVEISDNGQGISKQAQSRIFDPFYTTKPVGEGTGLGLSISHGIIQDHHGHIKVSSEVGQGTTFTLRIPVNLQPEETIAEETSAVLA